jgi:hypothetical protein
MEKTILILGNIILFITFMYILQIYADMLERGLIKYNDHWSTIAMSLILLISICLSVTSIFSIRRKK